MFGLKSPSPIFSKKLEKQFYLVAFEYKGSIQIPSRDLFQALF